MSAQYETQPDTGQPSIIETDGPTFGGAPATQFPIVAVGASAGGLNAFEAFLAALPANPGMAFILIQHLPPQRPSLLGEILTGHAHMPISEAAEGALVKPNGIYLIPPGEAFTIASGRFHQVERKRDRMIFDVLLRSLAKDCGSRSICVVLSGAGSDGSDGLKALKESGGFVVVQSPSEAAFDGMPRSAIRTGLVDLVLPVTEIPAALVRHAHRAIIHDPSARNPGEIAEAEVLFAEILDLVRTHSQHDFSQYKTGTLTRRIERRMAMARVADIAHYIERLKSDPTELDTLADDLLINVTQFFRDAAIFDTLSQNIIPEMVASQSPDRPLRIWVPGCSTGEEVYSLAILFLEAIRASRRNIRLQMFATDRDADAVRAAMAGIYGREIESQIGPERLAPFFVKDGKSYQVARELRDLVVFAVHDLLADPPFSQLDLISCRNVMIYLRPSAQDKILSLFHFALSTRGVLVLGRSEAVGQMDDRFEAISRGSGSTAASARGEPIGWIFCRAGT